MSHALRCRGAAPKTRSVLIEGTSAAVAMAAEFLERTLACLQGNLSTLTHVMPVLEKEGF